MSELSRSRQGKRPKPLFHDSESGSNVRGRVIIIGAGLVGALAATFMAKQGFHVLVFEKRPDMRLLQQTEGKSINLALSRRGLSALGQIGLSEEILRTLAIPMKGRMIHNVKEQQTSLPRRGLNEILLDVAEDYSPQVEIRFEEELVSLDASRASVMMQNVATGQVTVEEGDFILGCDGAYSATRRELIKVIRMNYSQEYIPHGYKEFSIPPAANGDWQLDPNHLHIWPRSKFMLIALPNPKGSFTATLFYPHELFEQIETPEDVRTLFEEHFPDALRLIGPDRLCHDYFANPTGSLVTMRYHYEDKVLLLGDAAHAMVPFYGQGMNAGFEDVSTLVRILNEFAPDRNAAFEEYSQRRHPDAQAICNLALYNYWEMSTAVSSPWFRLKTFIYGQLHRLTPSLVVPLYSMVAFSNIPYSQVVRRSARQELILTSFVSIIGCSLVGALVYLAKKMHHSF